MAVEKLEKKVSEEEFLNATKAAAEELGFKIEGEEVSKGEEKYKIKKIKEDKHKYGEGGHRLNSVVLYKVNGREEKIIEARNYTSWYSYSDDSADFPEKKENSITLYLEDKLGREVFEKLK